MNEIHTVPTLPELKRLWWEAQTPEVREALKKMDPEWIRLAFEWRGMLEYLTVAKFQ